jgi:hypothetical protein
MPHVSATLMCCFWLEANQLLFSGLFRIAEAVLEACFADEFNVYRVFSTSLAGTLSVQLQKSRSI